jgi:hypothetical protein
MTVTNFTCASPAICLLAKSALLTLACAAVSLPSSANSLNDTHLFRFGIYEQDIDIKAAANRDPFPEVELDFDKVLGLDKSSQSYFFQYEWRFRDKWSLRTFYTNMEADGEQKASKDFNWDGNEFHAGFKLGTEFGVDTYLVAVDYEFMRTDKIELGVGFGLHAFDIETTIEVEGRIADVEGQELGDGRAVKSNSALLAPLPNLRVFGRYAVTPKWTVEGALGWLSANYDDYDGDYLFLTLLTEYRITDRFGVGFAYQVSEIDITKDKRNGSDSYDIDQYGPSIFISYGF